MNNFNFQDLLANIQAKRKAMFSSYSVKQSSTSQKTTKSDISETIKVARERITKQVEEKIASKKRETLFSETPDKTPEIKIEPKQQEPIVYTNYGIVCFPVEETEEPKLEQVSPDEIMVCTNYGIVCSLDSSDEIKPVKENQEYESKFGTIDFKDMACTNYGIVCPLDKDNNNLMI